MLYKRLNSNATVESEPHFHFKSTVAVSNGNYTIGSKSVSSIPSNSEMSKMHVLGGKCYHPPAGDHGNNRPTTTRRDEHINLDLSTNNPNTHNTQKYYEGTKVPTFIRTKLTKTCIPMQTDTVFTCYQGIIRMKLPSKVRRYYLGIRYVVTEEINLVVGMCFQYLHI